MAGSRRPIRRGRETRAGRLAVQGAPQDRESLDSPLEAVDLSDANHARIRSGFQETADACALARHDIPHTPRRLLELCPSLRYSPAFTSTGAPEADSADESAEAGAAYQGPEAPEPRPTATPEADSTDESAEAAYAEAAYKGPEPRPTAQPQRRRRLNRAARPRE